jgi:hypothetical protein
LDSLQKNENRILSFSENINQLPECQKHQNKTLKKKKHYQLSLSLYKEEKIEILNFEFSKLKHYFLLMQPIKLENKQKKNINNIYWHFTINL